MTTAIYPTIFALSFAFFNLTCCHNNIVLGKGCTRSNTRDNVVCKLLSACPTAIHDLERNGIFPRTCGLEGPEPLVCCAEKRPVIKYSPHSIRVILTTTTTTTTIKTTLSRRPTTFTTPTITTTTTTTASPKPITKFSKIGDISKQKCKEYSQYVKEVEYSPILFPDAEDITSDECPIVPIELIVGGVQTKPKEFPHMALIGFDGEKKRKTWQCGGSLISELYVLTAGHCLHHQQLGKPKYIRIGDLSLSTDDDIADPQEFNIVEIIKHPDYKPPSWYNDIALLKMDRSAILNSFARPACLDTDSTVTVPYAVATGWGHVGFNDDLNSDLRKVTLEFFTNAQCNYSYRSNIGIRIRKGIDENLQVCAGSHTLTRDTCQADSGGPLQIINQDEYCMYTIVGVTSFGKACGVAKVPGVYTRVSNYVGWIESIVWAE